MSGDPRRFIGSQELVLPYLGGPFVTARDRRLQVEAEIEPGYWRFTVQGRRARPAAPAEAPDLTDLPAVRGHSTDGYVVRAQSRAELLFLMPEGELPRFQPVVGRRWPSGAVLFDSAEFETEAEEQARRAFEERRPLAGVKSVPATLRAAFGYATLLRVAGERDVAVSPSEARMRVAELADGDDASASALLDDLVRERARHPARLPARLPGSPPAGTAERIEVALRAAGGTLLSIREMGGAMIEVRYLLAGERFQSVADARTLQVLGAGICLSGSDEQLTMESLPGVILESMDTHQLNRMYDY